MLIVDELASLTAYIGDRKIRAEVEQLLGLLLSQGRAGRVSVVAAVRVRPSSMMVSASAGLRG